MAYFKNLITDKILKNKNAIQAQRLASCMAWQILNDYPKTQKPKEWQIYNNLRGVMLADEVGGGKTFETLAIISKAYLEQIKNQHDKRRFFRKILIIANPSIRVKWLWNEEQGLSFYEFISDFYKPKCDLGRFIKQTTLRITEKEKLFNLFSSQDLINSKKEWINFEYKAEGIWLTSFQSLPKTKRFGFKSEFHQDGRKNDVFPYDYFDWIIVDEAHSLKSGGKDVDEAIKLDGSAVRKIFAVLNASKYANLFLLTATPFQNNKFELQHLLSLLENSVVKDSSNNITRLISSGINELEKEIFNLDEGEISVEKLKQLSKNFNHDINTLLNFQENEKIKRPAKLKRGNNSKEGLDDFLRDIMIRNTKESLLIKQVFAKLNEAEKFQYLLYRDLIKTTEEESQMFSTKLSQLVSSRDSFSKSNINLIQNAHIEKIFKGNLVFETKYKKLIETIDEIKLSNGKNVITIFVSWIPTVVTLKKRLIKKYSKDRVFELTGQTPTDERSKTLKDIGTANKDANEIIILIASRVGNEGLDFDGFCNRVIHYDNNFNPAIIDQRNGRVYRGSNIKTSKKKVVSNDIEIYQLFIEETYDQRILFIEKEKRKIKNFYLGDGSLQKVLEKTIENNNLKDKKEMLNIIDKIRIDLTPHKKYILAKYKNEIAE